MHNSAWGRAGVRPDINRKSPFEEDAHHFEIHTTIKNENCLQKKNVVFHTACIFLGCDLLHSKFDSKTNNRNIRRKQPLVPAYLKAVNGNLSPSQHT